MGRFSLFIQQALILLAFSSHSAFAKKVEGIKFPETRECGGKTLPLQGTGLRTATLFNIRVYVMAYYAAEKKAPNKPSCFDLVYLRDFDAKDVDKAWAFQFKESSDFPYPQLDEHVKNIQDFFGEIKGDRKESFELSEGVTKVYEDGKLKGEIKGEEFQKNFLSLWFGKKPPTKDLQEELLK